MLDHLEDNICRVVADIRPQMLENSSKIGRPDWTTSEPVMAVLCQKSYLKFVDIWAQRNVHGFFQEQRIVIAGLHFAIKSHCRVINAFRQKYRGDTAPNASTITVLVQWILDKGSVADRKRSDRAYIVKTKVTDVETALQRSPLKRPPVFINTITEFIPLLKVMKDALGCSKRAQRVTHYGTEWKF
ncbi:DUF4817 domain-containing protein [Trichonephila clavipes]|nr:DUF4817 domain-containing protein [Trichonephila clavipes]